MSKKARLQLRLDEVLREQILELAKRNNTTVTAIVEAHFRVLLEQDKHLVPEVEQV